MKPTKEQMKRALEKIIQHQRNEKERQQESDSKSQEAKKKEIK